LLLNLSIRDILIVRALDLDFAPGLTVLTGETGSGKSILLDCLGLALGWRGRADVVRPGAPTGEVSATFALPPDHPARVILAEAGLPAADDTLILRRQVAADGRRSQWVNDRRAGAETLRALAETLVELHGQHDERGLLNPRGHRALLDDFAGAAEAVERCRAAWRRLAEARGELAEAEAALEAAQRDEAFLRHAVEELARLDPQPGEADALDARRRALQAGARRREDVARALAALGPEGAAGPLREADRRLGAAAAAGAEADPVLGEALGALGRARSELAEAEAAIEGWLEGLDADPGALEAAEERLFAIRALARKHGVAPDDLAALARDLGARLQALDAGAAGIGAARRAVAAAAAIHAEEAAALGAIRARAAGALDAAVAAELAPLRLERAAFRTAIAPAEPGPEGADAVSFVVATSPGAPEGPLDKIASGGELSRFLLALKVALAGTGSAGTLIFDEIDRGVGGATADAVGRRLAALAAGAQVLVVTHSAQVAARGAHHWRVEKRLADGVAQTGVSLLDPEARTEEIARMLAGESVTDAARAAAQALIAG
jgi:DNA repair protein RecN (Recombination protein N)